MKKLIFLPLLFICFAVFGQRIYTEKTFTVPYGADTTVETRFYSVNNSYSIEVNSTNVDGVDTLGIYCTGENDTTTYSLIWVDQDLNGVNDNPWTIPKSDGTNLLIWGESWPCKWIIYKLTKGTSTAGTVHYYNETKR